MEQGPSWKANRFSASQEIPAFYGTRMFITEFINARHLSLSWASSVQSIPPHSTSWRSILILSSHLSLGLPSGFLPPGFPIKTLYTPFPPPPFRYMPRPSNSSRFYHPHNIRLNEVLDCLSAKHFYCIILYWNITLDDLPVHVSTCIGHLQVILNKNEDSGVFMVLTW